MEYILIALFAVMIFFMFRNNRKRQREAAELRSSAVVGAEVMTSSGVYGTIIDRDDDENIVWLESTPGTVLRVHTQTVTRVITPPEPDETLTVELDGDSPAESGEPEYGERAEADTDSELPDSSDLPDGATPDTEPDTK